MSKQDKSPSRYANVPESVLNAVASKKIKAGDVAVFCALALYANRDGRKCFPGHDNLHKWTGYARRTLTASLQRLIAAGLIRRDHDGGNGRGSSEYSVVVKGSRLFEVGRTSLPPTSPSRAHKSAKVGRTNLQSRAHKSAKVGRRSD